MSAKQVLLKLNGTDITVSDIMVHLKATGTFKEAMQEVIENMAVYQQAEKLGHALTDEELQKASDSIRRTLGLYTAKDTEAYFNNLGLTVDQWVEHLEKEETRHKVMKNVITDEQVENYFNENRLVYKTVYVSKIVVSDTDTAEEIHTQVTEEDEEFSALARRFSQDEETKRTGGSMGKVTRGMLPTDAEGRIFAAEAETVLAPMQDGDTFVIYRIDAVEEDALTDALKQEIREGLFAGWLNNILAQSSIETP